MCCKIYRLKPRRKGEGGIKILVHLHVALTQILVLGMIIYTWELYVIITNSQNSPQFPSIPSNPLVLRINGTRCK
jgi:hypothetical protein